MEPEYSYPRPTVRHNRERNTHSDALSGGARSARAFCFEGNEGGHSSQLPGRESGMTRVQMFDKAAYMREYRRKNRSATVSAGRGQAVHESVRHQTDEVTKGS